MKLAQETGTGFLHQILVQDRASSCINLCKLDLRSIRFKKFVQEKSYARKHDFRRVQLSSTNSGVEWVIGARGELQFCRRQKL